ncbi:MAG: transcriptional repressor [Treponema sp.]|jgi:Fur family peroxide stress response transcriptional regulator|nr:transcriptional repressor [Treponema sp.]
MSTGKLSRKHSGKRDAILEAIKSTDEHPSAQRVYDRLKPRIPGLSLGTVYRNISVFRDEGDVVSVGVVNREERFDGKTAPHPHLVCGRCGAIADLPCPDEGALRRTGEKIADPVSRAGFVIDYRKTVFYGLCGACAEHSGAALREGGEAPSKGD